jgi:hypothetical protein
VLVAGFVDDDGADAGAPFGGPAGAGLRHG